jgi:hypothetical protein
MSSETEDMQDTAGETAGDGAKGTRRVVLRAVMVAADDLPADLQDDVPPAFVKTWLPVAVATGKDGEVIEAIAGQSGSPGCKPGEYRPVPAGAWFGGAPRVIEPELG